MTGGQMMNWIDSREFDFHSLFVEKKVFLRNETSLFELICHFADLTIELR